MSESNNIDKLDPGKVNACVIFIYMAELIDDPVIQTKIKEGVDLLASKNPQEERINLVISYMEHISNLFYEKIKNDEETRKNLEKVCEDVGVYIPKVKE